MECPKCHKIIDDKATVCPHCRKVLSLVCPNCQTISKTSVCKKCGYIILEKCTKCGRMVPTTQEKCKCGFSVSSSVACNECETDEFAYVLIKFAGLKNIRENLASQELYSKFLIRLKNLLISQLKGIDGYIINYGNNYAINFNKELSFPTSANKAVRLGLKLINAFTNLNAKVIDELGTQLKMTVTIMKKQSDELLDYKSPENNVKLLMIKKDSKKYLKGMQLIIDQFVNDSVSQDYKTDSLYSIELNGNSVMYYEVILDNYVLPPGQESDKPEQASYQELKKKTNKEAENNENDIHGFKVFDISAKCKFENSAANTVFSALTPDKKIITIRSPLELGIKTSDLIEHYKLKGLNPLIVVCNEELEYKPWGFFETLYKEFFGLSAANKLIKPDDSRKFYSSIEDLIKMVPVNANTAEDARYRYMEDFSNFIKSLKDTVIIVDGFEHLDDTSIQTLELYFDKYTNINVNFVFITDSETGVHNKIKGLMRTSTFTEITLQKIGIDSLLSDIKEDASDFIDSFYFEKIKENFAGSKLYFENAIQYLMSKDVLINFENKLIIKNNSSFLIHKDLKSLLKTRLKTLSKHQDASMILAYSMFLGYRIDIQLLEALGIKDVDKNVELLIKEGFVYKKGDFIYINNYLLLKPVISDSLKQDVIEFLAKNLMSKIGNLTDNTTLFRLMGITGLYKEEYLILWKNAQFAISVGDYDAYLKNCLGFLAIIDRVSENISAEDIENNKKEVFQNILMSLYSYSPSKIYSIENILLIDAMKEQDDEKIVKLSNLMLQGALISSNYTDALTLLHNILTRMPNPSLIVDGAVNTRFLLLSLVNIEILFNIGDFKRCIEVGEELLEVIHSDIIEKIKPANFSTNLFVEHLMETFRLVAFAKLLTCEQDLAEFFEKIKVCFREDLPDKNCIYDIKNFLNGQSFAPSNIEDATAFSKIIYLIMQEFSELKDDYKKFAQNIYQAKLLAADIHQIQLEYFCDILIAHSYAKIGITKKALAILNDVLEKAQTSAIYNIIMIANYYIAKLKSENSDVNNAVLIINDSLAMLQKRNNQAKVLYAIFEKLFIDVIKQNNIKTIDLNSEINSILHIVPQDCLSRIVNRSELENNIKNQPKTEKPSELNIPDNITLTPMDDSEEYTNADTDKPSEPEEDDLAAFVTDLPDENNKD